MRGKLKVAVAGHICLDVMPTFDESVQTFHTALIPGSLTEVGPARLSTGGAVPNTGLALHKLGIEALLLGKIGNDSFGKEIIRALDQVSPSLSRMMLIDDQAYTSYTVIINLPGTDRMFLHYPGANRTFSNQDVEDSSYEDAALFHFGYPPFMDRMFYRDGVETVMLLQRVKSRGLTTSLDMAKPDPNHTSGNVNWKLYLRNVLPFVDIFLPSVEELWYMLEPEAYKQWLKQTGGEDISGVIDSGMLRRFSDILLAMGPAVVVVKLGDQGLYVRTTDNVKRLEQMGNCAPDAPETWLNRELLVPCFEVQVVGTTGAGDCTIAGFLTGVMNGWTLEKTAEFAAAVGAFNVEAADATSGIRSQRETLNRIDQSWKRCQTRLSLPDLELDGQKRMFVKE